MPIQNMGTLLENIALCEAFALLDDTSESGKPIAFANSFAMPALTKWKNHATQSGFRTAHLQSVASQPNVASDHAHLSAMRRCLRSSLTKGPNGALLISVLAMRKGRELALWLNDVKNSHYGDAMPSLSNIEYITNCILRTPITNDWQTVVSDEAYPGSLGFGGLFRFIRQPQNQGIARIGYLDPMRYRTSAPQSGETSSRDHRQWLKILASATSEPVISVHFTGHRDWPSLREGIQSMVRDSTVAGYSQVLVASHSQYHVVTSIKAPRPSAAKRLVLELKERIFISWKAWANAIGRKNPNKLILEIR